MVDLLTPPDRMLVGRIGWSDQLKCPRKRPVLDSDWSTAIRDPWISRHPSTAGDASLHETAPSCRDQMSTCLGGWWPCGELAVAMPLAVLVVPPVDVSAW